LHGLAVPIGGQVDLEIDRRCIRVHWRNRAQHLAISLVASALRASAGTVAICAEAIVAPPLGSPISLAGIFRLARSAQVTAALAGDAPAAIRVATVLLTSAIFNPSMATSPNVL